MTLSPLVPMSVVMRVSLLLLILVVALNMASSGASSDVNKKYQSYTEVSKLTANELKAVCLRYHVPNSLPKSARIILLCHVLGLSTVGKENETFCVLKETAARLSTQQVDTLKKVSPVHLMRLRTWTKDISTLPPVQDAMVKSYLLGSNLGDPKAEHQYRLSRAYQLRQFVHSVSVTPYPDSTDFYCIQARCNPSQSSQADDVKVLFVVLDAINGDPCSAYCTCTVGFSQSCGHIGALLFVLSEWASCGLKIVPDQADQASCTDVLCKWLQPKGAAVKPKHFSEIGDNPTPPTKRRRTSKDYGQFIKEQTNTIEPPSEDEVNRLRANLLQATSHLDWTPAVIWSLDPSRFRKNKPPATPSPAPSSLPDLLPYHSDLLAYSTESTIVTEPLPIAFLPHPIFQDATDPNFNSAAQEFIDSIHYSAAECSDISRLTTGQSSNRKWFQQKFGSLTSSNFGKINRQIIRRKADPDKIVADIMGYKHREGAVTTSTTVPSLKHGIRYEPVARTRYEQRMNQHHQGLQIKETGLHVNRNYNFLRASPDGIVSCQCHPDRLLEIKCPYSAKDKSVRQAVRDKTVTYLTVDESFRLGLKKDHDYNSQIQGAMAATGLDSCDLVVYTKKTMEIITVNLDKKLWKDLETNLREFFEVYVVPEILTERVKKDLSTTPPPTSPNPTPVTRCHTCDIVLPESDCIATDNSNAAVACECSKCCCSIEETWYCWPCAGYSSSMSTWYCVKCPTLC